MAHDMRSDARRGERHRRGSGVVAVCKTQAHPHRNRNERQPYKIQVQRHEGRDNRTGGGSREVCKAPCRGRGVLCRRRGTHGERISRARRRSGNQGRCHRSEHPRHHGVLPSVGIWRENKVSDGACGRHRQGDNLHPLSQRPGNGHGKHAERRVERRAPGRGYGKRNRREGGQHVAGRNSDDIEMPQGHRHRDQHKHFKDISHKPHDKQPHEHARAAQQGDRGA